MNTNNTLRNFGGHTFLSSNRSSECVFVGVEAASVGQGVAKDGRIGAKEIARGISCEVGVANFLRNAF